MRYLLIIALALMPFTPSNAKIIRNNHIFVTAPLFCVVSKRATIFTYPPTSLHRLSIFSIHWSHDALGRVRNAHAQAKLGWRTDRISKGHVTSEGLSATSVVMRTNFYTEQCISSGFKVVERTKRTRKDC